MLTCCLGGYWPYTGNGGLIQKGWQVVARKHGSEVLYRGGTSKSNAGDSTFLQKTSNLFTFPSWTNSLIGCHHIYLATHFF